MALSQYCTPVRTALRIAGDLVRLAATAARSHAQITAENLFVTERSNAATEERLKSGHAVGGESIV